MLRICHRVGDLIHYEHDPALHDIVVLKPDWLATAISFVLDDKQTREGPRTGEIHAAWQACGTIRQRPGESAIRPSYTRFPAADGAV